MNVQLILIVILASLGSVVGSLVGIIKRPSERYMYNMLSFAGGVMLAISFLQLIPESLKMSSELLVVGGVLSGAGVMFFIDKSISHIHPELCSQEQGRRLKRTAVYLLVGIFLHNFPEGMAIAIGTVTDMKISLIVAIAIAIHNIPEGICTSAPYFFYTRKRLKSFLVSSLTAIPTLIGFFVASWLFSYIPSALVGFTIAATAGLMIYITGDEIIPTSCFMNTNHTTIFSLILGVLLVILLGLL